MIALSVNLNKIALIRNSREGNFPDLLKHARICIEAGAQGITVHPRPDQRHIRVSDIGELHQFLKDYPDIEFNIEGNPFSESHQDYPGFIALIEQFPPHQCTLVPDTTSQLTSDHGFDMKSQINELRPVIQRLKESGCRVSLFMDPDAEQIELCAQAGADRIELYTGPFAAAWLNEAWGNTASEIFKQHQSAAQTALECSLGINAGHDLNLSNLEQYHQLQGLQEVSIGHALTVDAINIGLTNAVIAYRKALDKAHKVDRQ